MTPHVYLDSRRTEYLRRVIAAACGESPAPTGTTLYLNEGVATGHGRLSAGELIPAGPAIDISGVRAGEVEYHSVAYLRHELRLGSHTITCYWHGIAGGFATVCLPKEVQE